MQRRNKRIVCQCCARQITSDEGRSDKHITHGPVKRLIGNQYVCYECGKDLDENGLFPEERK